MSKTPPPPPRTPPPWKSKTPWAHAVRDRILSHRRRQVTWRQLSAVGYSRAGWQRIEAGAPLYLHQVARYPLLCRVDLLDLLTLTEIPDKPPTPYPPEYLAGVRDALTLWPGQPHPPPRSAACGYVTKELIDLATVDGAFRGWLRAGRGFRGIGTPALARLTGGLCHSQIVRIESGERRRLDLALIERLLAGVGLDPHQVLSFYPRQRPPDDYCEAVTA